jgi:hypothetical protein
MINVIIISILVSIIVVFALYGALALVIGLNGSKATPAPDGDNAARNRAMVAKYRTQPIEDVKNETKNQPTVR